MQPGCRFSFCAYATRLPVHILRICNSVAGSHSAHMQPGCRFIFWFICNRLPVHVPVHVQPGCRFTFRFMCNPVASSHSGSCATRLPVHIPVHVQPGCRFTFCAHAPGCRFTFCARAPGCRFTFCARAPGCRFKFRVAAWMVQNGTGNGAPTGGRIRHRAMTRPTIRLPITSRRRSGPASQGVSGSRVDYAPGGSPVGPHSCRSRGRQQAAPLHPHSTTYRDERGWTYSRGHHSIRCRSHLRRGCWPRVLMESGHLPTGGASSGPDPAVTGLMRSTNGSKLSNSRSC